MRLETSCKNLSKYSLLLFLFLNACSHSSRTPVTGPSPSADGPSLGYAHPVNLSAAWANEGGEKIVQSSLRATKSPASIYSSLWNGRRIYLFGSRNEVINFNLVLEAASRSAENVYFEFDGLYNEREKFAIESTGSAGSSSTKDQIFNWNHRKIENFYVKYLKIEGLSKQAYESYDERHVPKLLQRPFVGAGEASGQWSDRPAHDQLYPDIAVPLELVSNFNISAGTNQSIWTDIYIPPNAPPGWYQGYIRIFEGNHLSYRIPVELEVLDILLPDQPSIQTMVYLGEISDLTKRYLGRKWAKTKEHAEKIELIRNRHFQLAHRHKLALVDADATVETWNHDEPSPEWIPRLDGSLFTSRNGYEGPGQNLPNSIYSIGSYGQWSWKDGTETDMRTHTDSWESWFQSRFPNTERFLYLADEPTDLTQVSTWLSWLNNNPGIGSQLPTLVTTPLTYALEKTPSLSIPATGFTVGDTQTWNQAIQKFLNLPTDLQKQKKRIYFYNGQRPASGSFAIEDDGIALRELAWGQYKMKIDRWFYWQGTYYNDFQSGRGDTNVFTSAQTFGSYTDDDPVLGKTGWNYGNGDGVLFYPGTEKLFPENSYDVLGPLASLRLKYWRRGIQDTDYLALAAKVDPKATEAIVRKLVPKVLWEVGADDPNDPTWVKADIGWPIDPEVWENARWKLAQIILNSSTD